MEGPQGADQAAAHGWCLQSVQQFSFLLLDLLGTSPGMFRARPLLGKFAGQVVQKGTQKAVANY